MSLSAGALAVNGPHLLFDTEKTPPPGDLESRASPTTPSDEKKGFEDVKEDVASVTDDEPLLSNNIGVFDPFPDDPDAPPETQLTVRALFVGTVLGTVIGASNIYLGLKTGWTFGAGLFGAIFGFAILRPLSKILPEAYGGGHFGPKENVTVQAAATTAGSLGLLFASGFPAMYQLGVMGTSPKDDIGRLFTFTLCCAYFGLFFTIPLRKFYILRLKLIFPSAVAAAYTIRSLHVGRNAEIVARKKAISLLVAFVSAISWRVVSEYAPGILWDWHWSYWFYTWGWKGIIRAENFYWVVEWTPAFIGTGLLVGPTGAVSFYSGAVLAWMIIGPALIATGKAFGTAYSPEYPGYINMMSMTLQDPVNAPSPRYWLIWPGILILLCTSFAEVACNMTGVWSTLRYVCQPILERLSGKSAQSGHNTPDTVYDPAPAEEQVPWWLWVGGLVASTVLSMIVLSVQFDQSAGVTLLAIIFAFMFSLIGAECTGRLSITPVTSIGNASQLVFGGINKAQQGNVQMNQRNNSLMGMLALGASEQCADLLSDLKTAYLLNASPRVQLYAQCVGALASVFISSGLFILFSTAYPCIIAADQSGICSFPAPDVSAWRAVAVAVSDPFLPIPPSSGYTAIGLSILAVLTIFVKYRYVPVEKHHWVPNWNAIGMAFILNSTTYPTAVLMGAIAALLWKKKGPTSHALYLYPVAAGLIAGEGLGGIVNAILQIAGVSGAVHGTAAGCPMNIYCG